jgi:hypothetical protein
MYALTWSSAVTAGVSGRVESDRRGEHTHHCQAIFLDTSAVSVVVVHMADENLTQ